MRTSVSEEPVIVIIDRQNIYNIDFDNIDIAEEWNKPLGREKLIHSIHAYPAKFPAFITLKAIQKARNQDIEVKNIADIFCGCGTVAYESVCSGCDFWGYDLNPVATLIAKVKSGRYDVSVIKDFFDKIITALEGRELDNSDPSLSNERIRYWFNEEQIIELSKLKSSIIEIVHDENYRNFFLCAFSNILKSCSRWLTKSIKPQVDPEKIPKPPKDAFSYQIKMMISAFEESDVNYNGVPHFETVNILERTFENPFIDLVVTSPPYVTSYEYADLHQLSSLWLGYTDDYRSLRKGSIGSLHNAHDYDENMEQLNFTGKEIVKTLAVKDKSKARSVSQYYVDMQKVATQVYKMLHDDGVAVFVIGNTQYKDTHMNNAKHLVESLINVGFTFINVDRRKISNKILTPYRNEKGKFSKMEKSTKKVYAEEFVIFARKTQ